MLAGVFLKYWLAGTAAPIVGVLHWGCSLQKLHIHLKIEILVLLK